MDSLIEKQLDCEYTPSWGLVGHVYLDKDLNINVNDHFTRYEDIPQHLNFFPSVIPR